MQADPVARDFDGIAVNHFRDAFEPVRRTYLRHHLTTSRPPVRPADLVNGRSRRVGANPGAVRYPEMAMVRSATGMAAVGADFAAMALCVHGRNESDGSHHAKRDLQPFHHLTLRCSIGCRFALTESMYPGGCRGSLAEWPACCNATDAPRKPCNGRSRWRRKDRPPVRDWRTRPGSRWRRSARRSSAFHCGSSPLISRAMVSALSGWVARAWAGKHPIGYISRRAGEEAEILPCAPMHPSRGVPCSPCRHRRTWSRCSAGVEVIRTVQAQDAGEWAGPAPQAFRRCDGGACGDG